MFFAKPGIYEVCGIFTKGHMVLFTFMVIGILIALYYRAKLLPYQFLFFKKIFVSMLHRLDTSHYIMALLFIIMS